MSLLYSDSSNITINVSTGTDLTNYNTLELLVRNPDGTTSNFDLTPSDEIAGECYYVTNSDDFATYGVYLVQAHVTFLDSDAELYGDIAKITVYKKLGD